MYNMLRHSKHYKRMQVGFGNQTMLVLPSRPNTFIQVARANDIWDKSLIGSDSLPTSPQPTLRHTDGGIFDDGELMAALEGFSAGSRKETRSEAASSRMDDTRRNSWDDVAGADGKGGPFRGLVGVTDFDAAIDEEPARPSSPEGTLSVDTTLGRDFKPVVRSLSTLDAKTGDMSRSGSSIGLARDVPPRTRRRRGVSFDEHVFVMEEPGVMFALKSSGPLTPFSASPSTPSSLPSDDLAPSDVMDDSDTEHLFHADEMSEDDEEDDGLDVRWSQSSPSFPSTVPVAEHVQWADQSTKPGPVLPRTSKISPEKDPALPAAKASGTLRQLFYKAIGIGD